MRENLEENIFIANKIKEGRFYSYSEAITLNGTLDYIITTPVGTNRTHPYLMVDTQGDVTLNVYEAPSFTDGTTKNFVNHNRNTNRIAGTLIKKSPTVTSTGTQMLSVFIPGANTGPMDYDTNSSFILKENTSYLIRYSTSASAVFALQIDIVESEISKINEIL